MSEDFTSRADALARDAEQFAKPHLASFHAAMKQADEAIAILGNAGIEVTVLSKMDRDPFVAHRLRLTLSRALSTSTGAEG